MLLLLLLVLVLFCYCFKVISINVILLGEVTEFSRYFRHLDPESNIRNPYISEMLEQDSLENKNQSHNPLFDATVYQSSTTTIQAIVALAAGLASIRMDLCQVILLLNLK